MVIVGVGPDQTPFTIHKDLICHYSAYFRAAFTGTMKEGTEGKVILDGVDTSESIFRPFLDWLYFGKALGVAPSSKDSEMHDCSKHQCEGWEDSREAKTILLYIFADWGGVPALKRSTVNNLLQKWIIDLPWTQSVVKAFDSLPETDPLLKVLIEIFAYQWDGTFPECERKRFPELPPDFTLGVLQLKGKIRFDDAPADKDFTNFCEYHQHSNGDELHGPDRKEEQPAAWTKIGRRR